MLGQPLSSVSTSCAFMHKIKPIPAKCEWLYELRAMMQQFDYLVVNLTAALSPAVTSSNWKKVRSGSFRT